MNNSLRLKTLLSLIILCITGIIFSIYAIDKQMDSYISEIKTEVVIVNNTENQIDMKQENDKTIVTINPKEESDSVGDEFYGVVTSDIGLNIRQEASVDSVKVGVLYYGEKVKILEDCGDWYRTEDGYIFKDYVIRI